VRVNPVKPAHVLCGIDAMQGDTVCANRQESSWERIQRFLFSIMTIAGAFSATSVVSANDLGVPVLEQCGDGQAANCWSAMVSGLKADGDGFLAVRSGPGSKYRKIDESTMAKSS
jgi:hypothetical protein